MTAAPAAGSSSAATTAAPTNAAAPASHFGDNRGIQFHIKTGNARYRCTLQDRSHYERSKAARQNSTDSVSSSASTSTTGSH